MHIFCDYVFYDGGIKFYAKSFLIFKNCLSTFSIINEYNKSLSILFYCIYFFCSCFFDSSSSWFRFSSTMRRSCMMNNDCSLSSGSINPRCSHFGIVVRAWLNPNLLRIKSIPYGSICCPAHDNNLREWQKRLSQKAFSLIDYLYLIVGSKCQVLQLKVRQSIRNDISISFLSAAVAFDAAIFLLPTTCRKSSELLILMLDVDDALERFVKFLLLLAVPRCCDDETDWESLAIDRVEAPIFVVDVSKLLLDGWLPLELPAAELKFGEPDLANCETITFSFSLRYEVMRSWRKKKASASTVTKIWSSNSVIKLHSTKGFSTVEWGGKWNFRTLWRIKTFRMSWKMNFIGILWKMKFMECRGKWNFWNVVENKTLF